MACSVLRSVCWCKCKMMLLKTVELLQIYTCTVESRARPSARICRAAGEGWCQRVRSCSICTGKTLVEPWCLTSAKATEPAPERSCTGVGPVLGCSQPKCRSLKAEVQLLMTRRLGGGCRDLCDRSRALSCLLPSLRFEFLLPSCVQAPRHMALPFQRYPLRCCEEATSAQVHQHSPVQLPVAAGPGACLCLGGYSGGNRALVPRIKAQFNFWCQFKSCNRVS